MPDFVGYVADVAAADEELLRLARERLEAARRFRRKNREAVWRENEIQYEGKHWSHDQLDDPAASLISVNVSFSTINTILPFVTAEEPRFLIEPYSTDAKVSNARLQQAWLNRYWRSADSGAQEGLEDATADKLIYGDGWLKISYEFKEKQVAPDTFREIVQIHVDATSPWDIWLDPNARDLSKARYLFHRFQITRAEMEADEERYGDVDLDALPWGNIQYDRTDSRFDQEERIATENEWMELFEYYDTVGEISLTFVDSEESPILRKIEGVGAPFVQMGNYYLPNSPYHMSELEQIKSIQDELNLARSELATHRRRNIAKFFVRKDLLDDAAMAALQSPIVGEGIPINAEVPLSEVIMPVQTMPLAAEAYASADQAIRDVYEITGVSEYLRGAAPEIRRTATEASIIEGASNVKVQAKLRKVEKAARRAGAIILSIAKGTFPETDIDEMGLFLTGDEAQRALRASQGEKLAEMMQGGIPDPELLAAADDLSLDQDAELRPTEEMFVGEYEVFVETASTELRNPIFKEQKFREMAMQLTNVAPVLAQLGTPVNLRRVYEKWFEAAGISDVEGMFEDGQALQPQLPSADPGLGPAQGAGEPNLQAAVPPLNGITPDNSGALLPTA